MPNDGGCCRNLLSYDLVGLPATAAAATTAATAGVAVACRVDAVSRRRHHRDRDGREILPYAIHRIYETLAKDQGFLLHKMGNGAKPSMYLLERIEH